MTINKGKIRNQIRIRKKNWDAKRTGRTQRIQSTASQTHSPMYPQSSIEDILDIIVIRFGHFMHWRFGYGTGYGSVTLL
jgi:hypothetical protein